MFVTSSESGGMKSLHLFDKVNGIGYRFKLRDIEVTAAQAGWYLHLRIFAMQTIDIYGIEAFQMLDQLKGDYGRFQTVFDSFLEAALLRTNEAIAAERKNEQD